MPQGPSPAPNGVATSSVVDPASPAFEAAHKAMRHGRGGLQFDFPAFTPDPIRPTPGWLKALAEALTPLAKIMPYIFWGGVAAGVLFLLYLVARELGWIRWTRRKRAAVAPVDYRPDEETARTLLVDADELAAQGRFAEAVHSLLLRSIDDMRRHRPRAVGPSLTSRDISSLSALPDQARPAFVAMAQAVERSLFGGRPVDRSDFDACRAAYADFAFPSAWS